MMNYGDEVVTCLPVVQEVLQGFRDEGALRAAREAMLALPAVESTLGAEVVLEAATHAPEDAPTRLKMTGVGIGIAIGFGIGVDIGFDFDCDPGPDGWWI